MRHLILFLMMLPCASGQCQTPSPIETVVTKIEQKKHGLSEAEVKEMNTVLELINSNEHEAAFAKLKPILSRCEARGSESGKSYVSVDSPEEFAEYSLALDKRITAIWIKDSCPHAYKTAAFLYVENNDNANAFKYLEFAANAAPFWAEPPTERGYLLAHLKDFPAAAKSYEHAISLADKYPNSAYVKPMALRGLGFVLIELGELEQAKNAFEESLKLEPNNKLAENELEYIRQVNAKN